MKQNEIRFSTINDEKTKFTFPINTKLAKNLQFLPQKVYQYVVKCQAFLFI